MAAWRDMKRNPYLNRHRWHILSIGIMLILNLSGSAMAVSLDEFRAAAQHIHTLKADFVQEKHLKILSTPLLSRGVFYYQAPDTLRWEYRSPIKSLMLMNKGQVSRYLWTESGFKEHRGPGTEGMQGVFGEINSWLKGNFDKDAFFRVRFEKTGHIILTPRDDAFRRLIQRIVLALSDRPGIIRSVTIYEGKDSFTRIVFNHLRINTPFDASSFTAHP
jgi:outer membrane lipoprotein-sorting protein